MTAQPRVPKFTDPLLVADAQRYDFAQRVVARLIDSQARVAVINDRGRAALVNCAEQLFDTLARDHEIVGVYREGVRVRDVVDDLKAAGL